MSDHRYHVESKHGGTADSMELQQALFLAHDVSLREGFASVCMDGEDIARAVYHWGHMYVLADLVQGEVFHTDTPRDNNP